MNRVSNIQHLLVSTATQNTASSAVSQKVRRRQLRGRVCSRGMFVMSTSYRKLPVLMPQCENIIFVDYQQIYLTDGLVLVKK